VDVNAAFGEPDTFDLENLEAPPHDEVKFVISDRIDYEFARISWRAIGCGAGKRRAILRRLPQGATAPVTYHMPARSAGIGGVDDRGQRVGTAGVADP